MPSDFYSPTKSFFFFDKVLPICNNCIRDFIYAENEQNGDWEIIDKICQMADIPFIPTEWCRLEEMNKKDTFPFYAKIFLAQEYEKIGWRDYYRQFLELKQANLIEDELPVIKEEKYKTLRNTWGANYDDEELVYLEDLFDGILKTQTVNGTLQKDQAQKIAKISLELDNRIREGGDFDKLLASYDKLVKTAEFTPKNSKNAADFDSVGELFRWLEKGGWKNKFFDGVTRDIVDETIKNFQSYNQRLYINETGLGEEITRRIEALKSNEGTEDFYDTDKEFDLDEFDNSGYEQLLKDNDFKEELE